MPPALAVTFAVLGLTVTLSGIYIGRRYQRKDFKDFYFFGRVVELDEDSNLRRTLEQRLLPRWQKVLSKRLRRTRIVLSQHTFQMTRGVSALTLEGSTKPFAALVCESGKFCAVDVDVDEGNLIEATFTDREHGSEVQLVAREFINPRTIFTVSTAISCEPDQMIEVSVQPRVPNVYFHELSSNLVFRSSGRLSRPASGGRNLRRRLWACVKTMLGIYVCFSIYSDIRRLPNWAAFDEILEAIRTHANIALTALKVLGGILVFVLVAGVFIAICYYAYQWIRALLGYDSDVSHRWYGQLHDAFQWGPVISTELQLSFGRGLQPLITDLLKDNQQPGVNSKAPVAPSEAQAPAPIAAEVDPTVT